MVQEGASWFSTRAVPMKQDLVMVQHGVTFYGKGWGHGIGLSQWGAQGWAEGATGARLSGEQIVAHYFPNAQLGTQPISKPFRVLLSAPSTGFGGRPHSGQAVKYVPAARLKRSPQPVQQRCFMIGLGPSRFFRKTIMFLPQLPELRVAWSTPVLRPAVLAYPESSGAFCTATRTDSNGPARRFPNEDAMLIEDSLRYGDFDWRRRLIADGEYNHHYAIPIGHIGMCSINGIRQRQFAVVPADTPFVGEQLLDILQHTP